MMQFSGSSFDGMPYVVLIYAPNDNVVWIPCIDVITLECGSAVVEGESGEMLGRISQGMLWTMVSSSSLEEGEEEESSEPPPPPPSFGLFL